MPPKDNITFGSGTLYYKNKVTGKWEPLTKGEEVVVDEKFADDYKPVITWDASNEMTFTMNINMLDKVIANLVLDLCPNPRVVHLARYSKKKRVRNKNYNRAIKIICKQGVTK